VKIPAEIKPESLTAIIDTREQLPLDLSPLQTELGTLATGDYSIKGLESYIAIERKSAMDMYGCLGGERERFERELQRMLAYPCRAVVVEAGWQYWENCGWQAEHPRSGLTAASAIGSLLGWIEMGIPIVMAYDHARAGRFVSRLLFISARRRYREMRALLAGEPKPEEEPAVV
jgi:DNA excision repair protein ERCC-4